MGFFDDFRAGLDRQKADTGRQASWFDPRAWSWPTRIAILMILLFALISLAADILIDIWGSEWFEDRLPGDEGRLPDWEPADPEPIPPRTTFPA